MVVAFCFLPCEGQGISHGMVLGNLWWLRRRMYIHLGSDTPLCYEHSPTAAFRSLFSPISHTHAVFTASEPQTTAAGGR